jgi:translation initiation factor 1
MNARDLDMKDITKKLKGMLACGGTFKGDQVELQGNHTKSIRDALVKLGFSAETIEIKG